jgi:cytoskeletal protein CcmA (bactofilin family)
MATAAPVIGPIAWQRTPGGGRALLDASRHDDTRSGIRQATATRPMRIAVRSSLLHLMLPLAILMFITSLTCAGAQDDLVMLGGDAFASGSSLELSAASPRDLFASAFSAELGGRVEGDLHATGFDVEIDSAVGGDLYAAGVSVEVRGAVGSDLTVAAGDLKLEDGASVAGNARIFAGAATLDGPVSGALMAKAGSLKLNGTVGGDAELTAGHIAFGPDARIDGTLTYLARDPIDIPPTVVPAERVRFQKLEPGHMFDGIRDHMERPFRGFWPSIFGILSFFVVTIAFLVLVAAVAHAFGPKTTEQLRAQAVQHPFRSILLGALGLSMLVGLVPVSALTLIGIPLIPIVILLIVAVWIAGYLLGVYAVTWRVSSAFSAAPASLAGQILVLTVGLILFALLNFIPFLGWLVNLAVVLLGLGALLQRGATLVSDRSVMREPAVEPQPGSISGDMPV